LPEINAKNGAARSFAERVAINMPIQGTASDIIKVAMINISRRLGKENLKTRMLLQVHDELIFETPENEIKQIEKLVKEEMEGAIKLDVPLIANISAGANWRDLEDLE
jgi:DNA polymerase-1